MSLLVNQNWIGLDGTPVTGATPPQLLMMKGRLTKGQYGAVAHAYHLFCLGKAVAVGEFFVANRTLSDGTRVRCESRQNIDRVLVWSTTPEDEIPKLPHGFGIVTDWQDPRFYWKPDKKYWAAPGNSPPQLQQGDVTYNHITYARDEGKTWEFYPLVHGGIAKRQWGWAPYKGLELTHEDAEMPDAGFGRSKNAIVPIAPNFTLDGKVVRRSRHFAVDDWILAPDGKKLYAMDELESTILSGIDPLRKSPPCSDAEGNEVALLQWRRWLSSPMNEVYRFRLCSEVLKRVGKNSYERLSRHTEEVTTQLRLPNKPPTYGEIEGEPEEPHLHRLGGVDGAGVSSWQVGTKALDIPGRPYVIYDPNREGFAVAYGILWFQLDESAMGGEFLRTTTGGYRKNEPTPEKDEYAHYLPIPAWSGIEYCKLINELAFPPKIFIQAGSKETRIRAEYKDVGSCYGLAGHSMYRRKAEHSIDEKPKLTLDFGWAKVCMLEAQLNGDYRGRSDIDSRVFKNSYRSNYQGTGIPRLYWSYGDITGMGQDDSNGATVGYDKYDLVMGALVDFDAIRAQYPGNNGDTFSDEIIEEPTCTVSYKYKSRYILDFDNRMQFCAALRVEVECTGASWSQIPDRYLGAIQSDGPSSYTVKVFFEVRRGATVYDKLLVEESVSKEAFEVRAILYDNVLIWPQADYDRPLYVYMPPELIPPMEAHMHIEAITAHQGVNKHLAGSDAPPKPPAQPPPAKKISEKQLEYSQYDGRVEIPHPKRPTGVLYARTFTLSEFIDNAFWMFGKNRLKFDASKNINYVNPDTPPWYYFPKLGAAITSGEKIHIEFRDDKFVDWSDDIPVRDGAKRPVKTERNIEVYYI